MAAYYEVAKHFAPKEPGKNTRGKPGTFERLAFEYYNTTAFKTQKPDTWRAVRGIIDAFVEEHGHRLVAQMRYEDAEKIISRWSDYNETPGTITLAQTKTDQEAKDESIVIPAPPSPGSAAGYSAPPRRDPRDAVRTTVHIERIRQLNGRQDRRLRRA